MTATASLSQRYQQARTTLGTFAQEHLLKFYDTLDDAGRDRLLSQIEAQSWDELSDVVESHVKRDPELALPRQIEPVISLPAHPTDSAMIARYQEARQLGENLLREGKVAGFTVAGGQGTRLGWDAPKGTFPCTPLLNKPLFQVFAENILKARQKYGSPIPWLIMTSPLNDAATRAFFQQHKFFGLPADSVTFFPQGTVPSFSTDGKALLAAPDELATNPDGHGGALRALHTSGALASLLAAGVEQISYWQVDNPIVKCLDPLFIGLHAIDDGQMSSKMLTKAGPLEKVGNFCRGDGRIMVIEYSDLPDELAHQRTADGSLRFNAGSIAIHMISVAFVQQLNAGRFGLPWHRAIKKVPHIDLASGQLVNPDKPNAVKLETFVFDALPLAERGIVLETLREEEFAPIKNAQGGDSPATSKRLQIDRAGRWLETAGVQVPWKTDQPGEVDALIELSPLTAVEPADLRGAKLPAKIERGQQIVL
jgi:UDP-N-acetylglucosamine/UDP-N-acetylgalactosamine diphosphorylase